MNRSIIGKDGFCWGGGHTSHVFMKLRLCPKFEEVANLENLFEAWNEFVKGKRGKRDVQEFSLHLADNILLLHEDLRQHTYVHGGYQAFNISDPKPRNIHKAGVRDRLVHHAIHRVLYPFFERKFISDSFSCRIGKGTHRALKRFRTFSYRVSKNNTSTCWVLQCDIKKFFASIDHGILMRILEKNISDPNIIWLLSVVIGSFSWEKPGIGLPLGNLTSQLFVNVYMNEFDQFMKHKLEATYYVRYADDFVVFSANRWWLEELILSIGNFLRNELRLALHPDKMHIKTLASGLDFLGWAHFPDHRVLRTTTRRRMFKRLGAHKNGATLNSYLGLLRHGNTHKLQREVLRHALSGMQET